MKTKSRVLIAAWQGKQVLSTAASAGETVREILSSSIDGPIVEDLPFGHVADNHALGVGVRCRLDGARGELTLLEPVVEVDR